MNIPCAHLNGKCTHDPDCTAVLSGKPCWEAEDVSCCRRNDKSRCDYCTVYLTFISDWHIPLPF